MRSSTIFLTCGAAMSATFQTASAIPIAGIIDGIIPSAFRPNTFNAATNRNSEDNRQTGAILESLRILPDDDNDGLVDVTGQLKALADGELLDLTGHVKVAGLLDTCVEVLIDGIPTRRCGKKSGSRKHRHTGGLRDDWSKEEHRRCSNHFRAWHRHHDRKDCSDELGNLRRRIAELERELKQCRKPTSTFQPNYQVKAVKQNEKWNTDNWNNENWKNDDNWNSEWHGEKQPQQWTWTDEHGKVWRNEAHNCKEGVYTYVDKDNINVKACIHAKVDLGIATAEADVHATATIDLSEGKVDATAKAKLDVEAGPVDLDSDTDVKANVDLKKGEAEVKVDTDNTLKLGDTKIIDTGLKAEVGLNKENCNEGSVLNAAGLCVKLKQEKPSTGRDEDHGDRHRHSGSLLLGGVLGGSRVL
ncbi:hypothetical protein P389DRAFT_73872 [Cystobasidium minutum MCA 4210]|uniref:uncharacterized protein n=1 Tax=Cystobasidium minutum MCA 4210 TaxID=1397322 RepID=UPI0034CECCCB|eukprot:jgi/Rhomi1/73872/CE73871_360